jgi:hypothetical protein
VQDRRWAATGTELVRWYDVVGLVVDELADEFVVLLPVRRGREGREWVRKSVGSEADSRTKTDALALGLAQGRPREPVKVLVLGQAGLHTSAAACRKVQEADTEDDLERDEAAPADKAAEGDPGPTKGGRVPKVDTRCASKEGNRSARRLEGGLLGFAMPGSHPDRLHQDTDDQAGKRERRKAKSTRHER